MKPFLELLPILLFFVTFKLYDIYIATQVIIVATIIQIFIYWLLYRKVENMQWMTLALILVMGGLTLYLHDEQFIKWKLTIIEWLFGSAFLVSQFIGDKTFAERALGSMFEQLLSENHVLPGLFWKRLNLIWSLFFYSIGFLNIYVMSNYSTDDWVSFKTFAVPVMMIGFLSAQIAYVMIVYKDIPSTENKK